MKKRKSERCSNTKPGQPRLGLVLTSGAARSFFQIGVLEAIYPQVDFKAIVGVGMGAYFGAALAAGAPVQRLAKLVEKFRPEDFVSPEPNNDSAFFSNRDLVGQLIDLIGNPQFDQLAKPFAVVATDLENNQEVIIDQGSVITAVEASMAQPGFHDPVSYKGKILVDGSIIDPLPLGPAWNLGCDHLVAIDTVSQHLRPFEKEEADLTFWIKHAWVAFPTIWLLNRRKIPWVQMRMVEAAYTDGVDRIIARHPPEVLIRLEETGQLAKELLLDGFPRLPEVRKLGRQYGRRISPAVIKHLQSLS